jgi:hypothetical protein
MAYVQALEDAEQRRVALNSELVANSARVWPRRASNFVGQRCVHPLPVC